MDAARFKAAQEKVHATAKYEYELRVKLEAAKRELARINNEHARAKVALDAADTEWRESQKGIGSGNTAKAAKGINTGENMGRIMAKPTKSVAKHEDVVPETKSEPIEPVRVEEEKAEDVPESPLNEEPAMTKEPETEETDEDYEAAMKAVGQRFDSIDSRFNKLEKLIEGLAKANFTSKPAPRDSDYPSPNEDGPLSDGLQAPRLTQSVNPNSKPFGKAGMALKGAADASKEKPGMGARSKRTEVIEQVLKGEKRLKLSDIVELKKELA